ncbi:hypothetical protein [Cupriavidus campinensis]
MQRRRSQAIAPIEFRNLRVQPDGSGPSLLLRLPGDATGAPAAQG